MPAFLVAALRIAFLALVWVFIAFAAGVIRTDIFGQRLEPAEGRRRLGRRRGPGADAVALSEPEPLATHLVVVEGRTAGTSYPLDGVLAIGRAASSTVMIDDDYSSSRHAQLVPASDGSWVLEDLNSTNGTHVNGVLISEPTTVGAGDLIRIGRTQLRLEA